jgi:hypothetical protein
MTIGLWIAIRASAKFVNGVYLVLDDMFARTVEYSGTQAFCGLDQSALYPVIVLAVVVARSRLRSDVGEGAW